MINNVILVGNITKDVELKTTASGKYVASYDIAVNDGYDDKKMTYFFTCVSWEKQAEYVSKYAKKGTKIVVDGKLTQRSYDDKNGIKHVLVEILTSNVEIASKPTETKESSLDELPPVDDSDLPF